MGITTALKFRIERRKRQIRAIRKRRELVPIADRTSQIRPGAILAFLTVRNEKTRLPFFLEYYRALGVEHFLFVDNGSGDGGAEYLSDQPDVSLWHTDGWYRESRFGTDWLNWLKFRYGHGHWTLTLDPDEFLVYPFCDSRPLAALCDWLDQSDIRTFGTLLLDLYPRGPVSAQSYREGDNPFDHAPWFDSANYTMSRNPKYQNLWIQGGPRARTYFDNAPHQAPSLNKIPLVKWNRKFAYVSSTHMLLPRGLNHVYDEEGGEKASGCLLHAKFLDTLEEKAAEEVERRQHFARGREYDAYYHKTESEDGLWTPWSERFDGWQRLEALGLMSKGNWA